jgi:hypothetical protein
MRRRSQVGEAANSNLGSRSIGCDDDKIAVIADGHLYAATIIYACVSTISLNLEGIGQTRIGKRVDGSRRSFMGRWFGRPKIN